MATKLTKQIAQGLQQNDAQYRYEAMIEVAREKGERVVQDIKSLVAGANLPNRNLEWLEADVARIIIARLNQEFRPAELSRS